MTELLDFKLPVAKWIAQVGVIDDTQGMHKLLATVYDQAGLPFPVPVSSINKGEDPAGRLHNWNQLLPAMQRTFAISLTADEKALLVAGDSEVLEHVIELVHSRGASEHHETVRRLGKSVSKKRWARQVDADSVSHVMVSIAQAAGVYACIMASLLSIFVPQWCPPNERDPTYHVCTTYDNFHELTRYNKGVLAINFITLFSFVATQTFFGYREYFVIEAFDLDLSLPADNLTEELELYPAFKEKLYKLNITSYVLSIYLCIMIGSNFILSCILILRDYSAGKTSVTGLISSALLVAPRCLAWVLNAQQSYNRGLPLSQFTKLPALANTIDADWRFKAEVYRPGGTGGTEMTENQLYSAA